MRMKNRGLSIMEIIISMILLGIGMLAVGQGYRAGRVFLIQMDNRAFAVSLVSKKMDKYLVRSYSALPEGRVASDPGSIDPKLQPEKYNGRDFNWTVDVKKESEGADEADKRQSIPYKLVTVICSYKDRNLAGSAEDSEVRMVNIKPYPAIHTESVYFPADGVTFDENTAQVVRNAPNTDSIIKMELTYENDKYETDKDILVFYNVTIKVRDAGSDEIDPLSTIYTECYIDGVRTGIITRTPITSQPLISNVLEISNVKKNSGPGDKHTIEVKWYKDQDAKGTIVLKQANLMALAVEHKF
jgi:hypothetical protein